MPSRVQTIPKLSPTTAEEARNAILVCLSSDGTDDSLHEHALEGLRFLEQNTSNFETHRMRMALMLCRKSDKITAKVRKG
jgi:hypothetical protein